MRWLILLLFLVGCNSKPPLTHFTGIAMTIPYHITVGGPLTATQKREIESTIGKVFAKTHQIFNNWNPHSEVSQLSTLPAGVKAKISPELKELLLLAQKVHLASGGKFDPTVALLSQKWKRALCEGCLPQVIDNEPLGISKLHIEEDHVWKEETIALDLGGIAKGHAVDLLTEGLVEAGFHSLYVEWGGEIRTVGHHPEGRKWTVRIKGVTTLELSDLAIATSGNYEQVWEVEGVRYTHIIDPLTKRALVVTPQSIASATVVAPTCAFADAVATALMLFETPEEALAWAGTLPNVQVWIATSPVSFDAPRRAF